MVANSANLGFQAAQQGDIHFPIDTSEQQWSARLIQKHPHLYFNGCAAEEPKKGFQVG
jgi:hypothetical protein